MMKHFISEIKKIHTDGLIYRFSELSIEMFRKNQCMREVAIPVIHLGRKQTKTVMLVAWDFPEIAFLSVKHSNDHRNADSVASVGQLVDLYRDYDNEHSPAEMICYSDADGLHRIILGMTAEQFQYQNLGWIFEKFNRDYYILLAANHFEHRSEIDANAVVSETFGYSAEDYVTVLLMVYWLCSKNPAPLSAPEELYHRKALTVLTKENIQRFVEYYSCTYTQLRETPLGKQLLYSKPFIRTQRKGDYLAASMFLVAMITGNGLYWLVRDYYHKKHGQKFVNAFGLLFEDYVKDLAQKYCESIEWERLPAESVKGADFLFDFGICQLLIECKSSLLRLDAKQQVPNLMSTDTFFKNTIAESYEQLSSSYQSLREQSTTPIIKVILLYDEFSNTSIIEHSMSEVFHNDPSCFVMTIRHLEMLLYIHRYNKATEQLILNYLLDASKSSESHKSIEVIFRELSIFQNQHLTGDMDFYAQMMDHFAHNLY